ncbi:MAG TPA: Fe-S cluster assembly protein SufD [Chloroflexota bacterium]|nr:Fe-S cluster assembly protein SufD [Chloroflexota bacterium]
MSSELISANRFALTHETVEELSRRRQEPDWLLAVRLRALEAFERLPMPDQRTEGWRRTSLRGLTLDSHDPIPSQDTSPIVPDDMRAQQAGANLFAYRNGMAVREDSLDAGWVMDLQDALQEPLLALRIEKQFGKIVPLDADKFTALHYAFFNAGVVVFLPRGTVLESPIWVAHDFDQPGHAAFVHTLILAEDESDVRLIEEFRGGSGLASGVVEQVIGANAHLRYGQLQRWSSDVWNFSTQRAVLAQDASIRTLNVAIGGRMARNTVQVRLEGARSQADLLGIVDANQRQHIDFETLQDHVGDGTRSDLVIHNALRDRASTNFTGLIRINKSAHQTESSQEQKNVLLSEQSKADSDPKLEILNNDVVRCTHGASVGPVDQEMVFYLESRGLDRESAEQLIVEGFFQSVLKKLEMPTVAEAVWSAITEHDESAGAAPE